MSTIAHRTLALSAVPLLCALIFMNALPSVARSQSATSSTSTPPATSADTNYVPADALPYKTEQLLGNQVIGDFVVGPGKIELEMEPGQTRIVEMTVSNRTGQSRVFEIEAEDATGSTDPTRTVVLLGDDRGPYSMKDYISIDAPRFELPHNTRATVPVTISVPADAEPGGLYGSVLVSTVSREAEDGSEPGTASQSAIVTRIGTLFFIRIPGEVNEDAALVDFSTIPKKSVFGGGPITFGLTFENNSSVHLTPSGDIRIRNMFGEEVGLVELDPWFVLPDAIRLREVVWNREFLFGKYTATAQIDRGYKNLSDTATYSFWVLPWKPLLGAFAVIFIVIFLTRTFFKRFEFRRKPNE